MKSLRARSLEQLGLDETLMSRLFSANERYARWLARDKHDEPRGREDAVPRWYRDLIDPKATPDEDTSDEPPADGNGNVDEGHAPIARADKLAVFEGQSGAAASVLANDRAAEGTSDRLHVAKVNGTEIGSGPTQIHLASGAIVTMYRDGHYSYDQNGAFEHVSGGDQAVDSFRYTVSNGHGEIATTTVRITITGINDTPTAQDVTAAVGENDPAISISAIYSDVDSSSHVFGAVTAGTIGSVHSNGDGTFTYDPNGMFEHLADGETATDSFRYTISDGSGITVFRQMTITITGANDDPTAQNVTADVDEDGPSALILASYADPDTSDTHTFTIDTTGTAGLVVDNGDGTFSYDPNGAFDALAGGETATASFTYTVDDGHGGVSTAVVTVTIHGADEII